MARFKVNLQRNACWWPVNLQRNACWWPFFFAHRGALKSWQNSAATLQLEPSSPRVEKSTFHGEPAAKCILMTFFLLTEEPWSPEIMKKLSCNSATRAVEPSSWKIEFSWWTCSEMHFDDLLCSQMSPGALKSWKNSAATLQLEPSSSPRVEKSTFHGEPAARCILMTFFFAHRGALKP